MPSVSAGRKQVPEAVSQDRPLRRRAQDAERVRGDAARGQAERDRHVEDHQETDPLGRHGVEGERRPQVGRIGGRAPPPGGHHPRDDPDHDRDHRPGHDHRQRVQERLGDVVPHRPVVDDGRAQVAVGKPFQVDLVLLPLGLVEPVLAHDRLAELLCAVPAAEPRHRVPGQRAGRARS